MRKSPRTELFVLPREYLSCLGFYARAISVAKARWNPVTSDK